MLKRWLYLNIAISILCCFVFGERKKKRYFLCNYTCCCCCSIRNNIWHNKQRYIQCCHAITRKSSISSSKRWCVRVYCRWCVLMLPLHTFNQANIVVLFLLSFQYFTFFCSFQHSSMQFSLECACFFLFSFSFGFRVHSIFFCGIIYRFAIAVNTHSLRWFEYDSLYNFAYNSYSRKLTHSKCMRFLYFFNKFIILPSTILSVFLSNSIYPILYLYHFVS